MCREETFFFVVQRKKFREDADKELFLKNLKTRFPSVEFMGGYAEGYGFGGISILTPEQLAVKHNANHLKDSFIFTVYVEHKVEMKCPNCGDDCDEE